jgi:hypothetical protein
MTDVLHDSVTSGGIPVLIFRRLLDHSDVQNLQRVLNLKVWPLPTCQTSIDSNTGSFINNFQARDGSLVLILHH